MSVCFQPMAQPLCPLRPHRRSRTKRRMGCQRSCRVGRPSPDLGQFRSGPSPTPGPCCEDATRATPWATTPERRRHKTWTWCCPRRWGWAAPCWTWTQRARNETALCHCAAFRAPRRGPPSLSWRKSSSLERWWSAVGILRNLECQNRQTDNFFGLKLLEGLELGCLPSPQFYNIEPSFVLALEHVRVLERNKSETSRRHRQYSPQFEDSLPTWGLTHCLIFM